MYSRRVSMRIAAAGMFAAVVVSLGAWASRTEQDAEPPDVTRDKVAELLDMHKYPDATWSNIHQQYAELIQLLDNDPERVLDQILVYAHHVPHGEDAMARAWNSMSAILSLFSPYARHRDLLMERLTPSLASDDEQTQFYAENVLLAVVLGHNDADSYVIRYLRGHDEEDSYPLLRMLFERRPGATVEIFHRWSREERAARDPNQRNAAENEVIRHVAVVEHARMLWDNGIPPQPELAESARSSIQALIATDVWWGRAYAAGIMNLHPRLRHDEAIQRLSDENHPVVRELAAQLRR